MPITLAEAKRNAVDDVDVQVIDEFRKESAILDAITFDDVVNPAGGGGTLTYGYRRLVTQPTADTREINTEYTPQNVTTERHTTDLGVLGGAFEIDRVLADVGPAASGAVALNMAQKVKAANAKFSDLVINGDTGSDAAGFDGLNKALSGSSTELGVGSSVKADWSDFDTTPATQHKALDLIDEFLQELNGEPTMILANKKALARVRAAARRASMYTQNPVEGLIGQNGRPIVRETYGNIVFVDPGAKAGTNDPIIPIVTRSTKWKVTEDAGQFVLIVDGVASAPIDAAETNAGVQGILEAIPGVTLAGTPTGTPGTSCSIEFSAARHVELVNVTGDSNTLAENSGTVLAGVTDLYAVRFTLDGFKGLSTVGGSIVKTYLPDFSTAGAVKKGEVELGPVGVALMATKAAAVLRNIKV